MNKELLNMVYILMVCILMEENQKLAGDVVFITKQVRDRDNIIQSLEELAKLGIHD